MDIILTQSSSSANITLRSTGGILQSGSSGKPVTLNNLGAAAIAITSFGGLNDVNANSASDGDVPIYDSGSNSYIVQTLNLDGGSF